MATEIQFNVDAALAKLEALVQTHGPQAVEMAAQVERVNAINSLSGIVGWGIVASACCWTARWCLRRSKVNDEAWGMGACAAWVVGGIFGIIALTSLFDVWAWVALFNPKLALAHDILSKLVGS